jgi:hypothetical protein
MTEIVMTVSEAEAAGYEPWHVAAIHLERPDGSRPTRPFFTQHARAARLDSVLVKVTPGRGRPQRWFLRRGVIQLGRIGYGGTGNMKQRWDGDGTGRQLQGRQAHREEDQRSGIMFINDVRVRVSEEHGRAVSEEVIRNIPAEILRWHTNEGGTGNWRRYDPADVDEAMPQILQRIAPKPPEGFLFRKEAAAMIGVTKLEWVDDLGRQRKLEVHPTCKPRAYSIASLQAYNESRAFTKGAPRIVAQLRNANLMEKRLYFLDEAAAEIPIHRDLLMAGIRRGFVRVAEWRTLRGKLKGQPILHEDEVRRIQEDRPQCVCGCGELAWHWRRRNPGHHLTDPLHTQVAWAIRHAMMVVRATGNVRDSGFDLFLRGLCARLRLYDLEIREKRTANHGKPVSSEALRRQARMVSISVRRPTASRAEIAAELGVTPRRLDKMRRDLSDAGEKHDPTTCKSCCKRLNGSRAA